MIFLMAKVLECLQLTEDLDLGLKIPVTLTLAIMDFKVLVVEVATMEKIDIGINRPDTLTLAILDQALM